MRKDGVRLSKAPAQEMTPSPIAQSKGRIEASMGSPLKKPPTAPKNSKGNEKNSDPSKEPPVHMDLHSFEESNEEGDSLLILLNEPIKDKRGK
jgi:hypothetical protein